MKIHFQKILAVISACVILLSLAAPAFATEPTAAEAAIDYDNAIVGTWYINLDGKMIDDYVFPDNFTWSGTMDSLSTGTPDCIKFYYQPVPLDDRPTGKIFEIVNSWGFCLALGQCGYEITESEILTVPGSRIACNVTKIRITAPDPVSANNEKLYNWFVANGITLASFDQGGSSGDDATEQVSGLDYSFWQLNETISSSGLSGYSSLNFSLPYVDPEVNYTNIGPGGGTGLSFDGILAYSFKNNVWSNDKYRYLYFGAQSSPNASLLRWLKDNGRLVVQSIPAEKPTIITDLFGLTWTFPSSGVVVVPEFSVTVDHVTDVYPSGSSSKTLHFYKSRSSDMHYYLTGSGKNGYLLNYNNWSAKWIRFTDHCSDKNLIDFLLKNATLTGWPTEPPQIPSYAPPEVGGVLGSLQVDSSGGDQSGWITGGGLIGSQPLPGLNAGFLSWLAGTMDGIMNVNLFGFFSIADILSYCMTISIILILLKFFGG